MEIHRRGGRRRAAAIAVLLPALILVTGLLPHAAVADSAHSVDSVQVSKNRGFVNASAWFVDGPGGSAVTVWIEAYRQSTGQFLGLHGRRDASTSCTQGRRCYVALRTSSQIETGECYIARAISYRQSDGSVSMSSDPASGTFCP